ncbi:Xaa-Pro peptidase family protein [Clostridium aestuarii]|uniref:Xaa-Pro peptidase family protein n=1 Tax=Clostridium aestuarii TaxID=338193 RepID=A0ABT4D3H7_9CLOT|nr:Xaa-Pro peptidase family protein [Clostridium aestuarii]MCY6485788.1 Xaa-Pro peptidase family protein [Clostridium aestuarii]
MKTQRIERIINNMKKHNLQQIIITSTSSIFYLTGEWIEPGERMLALYINVEGDKKLFINELFPINRDLGVDLEVYNDAQDPIKLLVPVVNRNNVIGIDKEWPSHFLISLMEKMGGINCVNGGPIVDEVRMIKDDEEIELMREASRINDKAMGDLIKMLSKDYSEKKACKMLGDVYEKYGTSSFSFYPLIAYGANAAEPHHSSDESMAKKGDSVILDIGGRTNNYCSDMTRTVFYKEPEEEYKKIYNIVLQANLKGIEAVKPGVRFSDIDKASREVIEKHGYGKYFTHRTGHNVGIDVHEFPDVGASNEMIVQEGMIFSIEPGIYISDKVGVRIEDLVLVTKDGCEILNKYPKELNIIE